MSMRENQLKKRLKSGGVVLGTALLELRGRGAVYPLAEAGMEFVFICTEHSSLNLETVVDLVAHSYAAGIAPIVRVPDLEYQAVTRLLDSGCQSLILPHARTGDDIQRFIEYAKYHPQGRRGMAIYGGASTNYAEVDQLTAMEHANANTLLGLVIETREAIANIEDILIPGIDLVIVGHQDLSQSLGIPGQYAHASMTEATNKVRALCKERDIATAGVLGRPDQIKASIDGGAQFLMYGADVVFLRESAKQAVQALAAIQ
jgi:2-keto-3-deoxy-L-rhamnonate aldolase RhmA